MQRNFGKPALKLRDLMRSGGRSFQLWAWVGALLALLTPGCNQGLGAFQAGVGNTPNSPPLAAFRILGQAGMQFSALVSDADASWPITGSIPMNVVIVNNQTPVRMIATKQSAGTGLLSLQVTVGFTVEDVSSTSDPFGTISIQNNFTRPGFDPPPPQASPDVRLFVKGPASERFSGLFEDSTTGFILSDRAPALVLFDNPDGAVDASLQQIQNKGPFNVDLFLNGNIVAHVTGAPTVTIRQP
jgi:hypothetical protein